jgi:hypothetical protein
MKMTTLILLGSFAAGTAMNVDAAPVRHDQFDRGVVRVAYDGYRGGDVDDMITRAYRDILGREPDPSGFASFRREILYNGMSEAGMRQAMLNSDEYRSRIGGVHNRTNNRPRARARRRQR